MTHAGLSARTAARRLGASKSTDIDVLFEDLPTPVDCPSTAPRRSAARVLREKRTARGVGPVFANPEPTHKRLRFAVVFPSPAPRDAAEVVINDEILAVCDGRIAKCEGRPLASRPPRPNKRKRTGRAAPPEHADEGDEKGSDEPPVPSKRFGTGENKSKKKADRSLPVTRSIAKPKRPKVVGTTTAPKRLASKERHEEAALYIPRKSPLSVNASGDESASHIPAKPSKEPSHREKKRPRSSRSPSVSKSQGEAPPIPRTPLEHILSFARGISKELSKMEKTDKKLELKTRTSLATFAGCAELSAFGLAAYVRELAKAHLNVVKSMKEDGSNSANLEELLDNLACGLSDEDLADAISTSDNRASTRQRLRSPCPPSICRSVDLIQLAYRLVQKMRKQDDEVSRGFYEDWYESNTVLTLSSFAISVLTLWESNFSADSANAHRVELVGWCVRLVEAILIFELSPISSIREAKGIKASTLLISVLGKDDLKSLPDLIDAILCYVNSDTSNFGRECKVAASELCQIYVTRHHYLFDAEHPQFGTWNRILCDHADYIRSLMDHPTFWSSTALSAIQSVRKALTTQEALLEIAFLNSLLSETASSRSLLQKQAKPREALLAVFCQLLGRVGRNPLAVFIEIGKIQKTYPKLPLYVDLIRKLMSFAVVQRELISSQEHGQKEGYLESIQNVIASVSKLVRGRIVATEMQRYAREGTYGKRGVDPLEEIMPDHSDAKITDVAGSEEDDEESARESSVARHRALSFCAWLLGSLGKSMEDGSRDMSQMNGLQVLLSRFTGQRALMGFWENVFKVQVALEQRLPADLEEACGDSAVLLSASDRNYFSMVMHAIHLRIEKDRNEKSVRATPDNSSKSSPETNSTPLASKLSENFSFPVVKRISELRSAVCTSSGYRDLDDDVNVLKAFEKISRKHGKENLARYERDSEYATTSWVRLQRRNVYIDDARELLERSEKILGNPCSCLPGNHPEGLKGSQSRIACCNDLCENRSAKVECVPGECGANSYCQNQRLQRLEYAKIKMVVFPGKGVGVVADENIRAGSLVGEYQGEVISKETFQCRRQSYTGERHFYFMTLTSKLIIDASRKSQATRFVNHSCDPNAETQKWNAGGEPRVGIYALRDIPKGEEVTFDYGARSLANDPVPCLCGTKKCRGFLTSGKLLEIDSGEITVDKAGLANVFTGANSGKLQTEFKKDTEVQVEKVDVDEMIRRGRAYIQNADGLKAMIEKLSDVTFNEDSLDENMKTRLRRWEASIPDKPRKIELQAAQAPKAPQSGPPVTAAPVPQFRIPRRGPAIPAQESILKKFVPRTEAQKAVTVPRRDLPKKAFPKPPTAPADVYINATASRFNGFSGPRTSRPHPQREASDRYGRVSTCEQRDAVADNAVDRKRSPPRAAQRKTPFKGFLPTESKNKKPRPMPKFASRARAKGDDSNEDSMDEYSVASDAEPIIDEPPLSPSNLPDGTGACSDDEFVAAPPVGSEMQKEEDVPQASRVSRPPPLGPPLLEESRAKEHAQVGREAQQSRGSDLPRPENRSWGFDDRRDGGYRGHSADGYHSRNVNGHDVGASVRNSQGPPRDDERSRWDERRNPPSRDLDYRSRFPGHQGAYPNRHDNRTQRAPHLDRPVLVDVDARRNSFPSRDINVGYRNHSPPGTQWGHGDRRGLFDQREGTGRRDLRVFRDGYNNREASMDRAAPKQWHGSYREPADYPLGRSGEGFRERPLPKRGDMGLHRDGIASRSSHGRSGPEFETNRNLGGNHVLEPVQKPSSREVALSRRPQAMDGVASTEEHGEQCDSRSGKGSAADLAQLSRCGPGAGTAPSGHLVRRDEPSDEHESKRSAEDKQNLSTARKGTFSSDHGGGGLSGSASLHERATHARNPDPERPTHEARSGTISRSGSVTKPSLDTGTGENPEEKVDVRPQHPRDSIPQIGGKEAVVPSSSPGKREKGEEPNSEKAAEDNNGTSPGMPIGGKSQAHEPAGFETFEKESLADEKESAGRESMLQNGCGKRGVDSSGAQHSNELLKRPKSSTQRSVESPGHDAVTKLEVMQDAKPASLSPSAKEGEQHCSSPKEDKRIPIREKSRESDDIVQGGYRARGEGDAKRSSSRRDDSRVEGYRSVRGRVPASPRRDENSPQKARRERFRPAPERGSRGQSSREGHGTIAGRNEGLRAKVEDDLSKGPAGTRVIHDMRKEARGNSFERGDAKRVRSTEGGDGFGESRREEKGPGARHQLRASEGRVGRESNVMSRIGPRDRHAQRSGAEKMRFGSGGSRHSQHHGDDRRHSGSGRRSGKRGGQDDLRNFIQKGRKKKRRN